MATMWYIQRGFLSGVTHKFTVLVAIRIIIPDVQNGPNTRQEAANTCDAAEVEAIGQDRILVLVLHTIHDHCRQRQQTWRYDKIYEKGLITLVWI